MNVSLWLKGSSLDSLDAELILARVLNADRTFLHAHPERELTTDEQSRADSLATRRSRHEPLAYLFGYKEFYSRVFAVTPDVLIPRPETEDLVRCAITVAKTSPNPPKILDVGTGSGCIAITLAKELPTVTITGVDISKKALEVAKTNAKKLKAKVDFYQSNLLEKTQKYDIIIANLPYVNKDWDWLSSELAYEPQTALYSSENGLTLIKELIRQSPSHLYPNSHLILEADLTQHAEIEKYAQKYGFSSASSALTLKDSLALCLYRH